MGAGIAAVGECMLELSGQRGPSWTLGHAGDTFNTLWTLRALTAPGSPVDFVSAFGDDPFSAQQVAFLKAAGIGTASSPVISGARPGLYAITLTEAERSFTYWRADSAARQLASDADALTSSLVDRRLIFFSGITLGILSADARRTLLSILAEARALGSLIAFDPNYRPRLWPDPATARAAVEEALDIVDIALPTHDDEKALFGDASPDDTARRIIAAGIGEIVIKDGALPATVVSAGTMAKVSPVEVGDAVDTTGAGDGFNGGYLAARLKGHPPDRAAAHAHRVAGAVIRVHGALAPVETLRRAFEDVAPTTG